MVKADKLIRFFLLVFVLFVFILFSAGKVYASWYNSNWNYRQKITINSSLVPGNLSNFPVLISKIDTNLIVSPGGKVGKANGGDILFANSAGTVKYNHEIESYNSTTGELIAWVRVPSVLSTSDTVFYMYYGNPVAADQWDVNGTWDGNYESVLHLNEDPSGTPPQMQDSTSNNNHGTSNGGMSTADQVAGQITGSLDFDGSNDRIAVPNNTTPNFTASAWIYHRNTTGSGDPVLGNTSWSCPGGWPCHGFLSGYVMRFWSSDTSLWYLLGQVSPGPPDYLPFIYDIKLKKSIALQAWTHVAMSYDASSEKLKTYINGDLINGGVISDDCIPPPIEWCSDTGPYNPSTQASLFIASDYTNGIYFNGIIDEVRISDTARSDAWIMASFNNQNGPSAFLSFGMQQVFTLAPAMNKWGMIIFIVLAGLLSGYRLKRKMIGS